MREKNLMSWKEAKQEAKMRGAMVSPGSEDLSPAPAGFGARLGVGLGNGDSPTGAIGERRSAPSQQITSSNQAGQAVGQSSSGRMSAAPRATFPSASSLQTGTAAFTAPGSLGPRHMMPSPQPVRGAGQAEIGAKLREVRNSALQSSSNVANFYCNEDILVGHHATHK
ncbi:unnamed protein product [Protopolystoma xenopodis]|uniref:Uncharacterized protein n=1 Tax=Protopolystoma xenopodis TaxID=117903 RepID=A0A448WH26_9PLAT|nr:unnamed protein product [Protopolystoma xenopodis]